MRRLILIIPLLTACESGSDGKTATRVLEWGDAARGTISVTFGDGKASAQAQTPPR